jgi:hypothetical protein
MPKLPALYLESKHADIQAHRGEDFHYSWKVGKNQLLTVEYIPSDWPPLTCSIGHESVDDMKKTLREIGFDIEGEEDADD